MSLRIFIFGAGYSGRAIGREMRQEAEFLGGTTRSPAKATALDRMGILPFVFDGYSLPLDAMDRLRKVTHLVVSAAPGDEGDPVLAAAEGTIRDEMPALEWIGYLSTVGVYGDHDGQWVTEESELRPSLQRTEARVEAEGAWTALGRDRGVPVAILRLSGIYGPGRNALANIEAGNARRIVKPGQVFNRIHVADIAGATAHLARAGTGGVFNVSDDEPSPPQDVILHAARLMGTEPPPEIPFDQADLSEMARSFYGETKRVSNRKIKEAGYRFRFPDYREALDAMWRDGTWKAEPR